MKVAILGGGAAGFFAAISVKKHHPNAEVMIFEKSHKLLSKVRISGGGRCNVTNACFSIAELSKAYPRGGKQLKKIFPIFNPKHTMKWFESKGVALKVEAHNHVFPVSNSSETIIDCLIQEAKKPGCRITRQAHCMELIPIENGIRLRFKGNSPKSLKADRVIVATGGSPKRSGLEWIERLGHHIEHPVPSLFTFNMPNESIKKLMGVAVPNAAVRIQGTKLLAHGPLLITHWGLSGPAILKLSAFGARVLSDANYHFSIQVNWTCTMNDQEVKHHLNSITLAHPNKSLASIKPFALPDRFWKYLLHKVDLQPSKKWRELGKKGLHKLTNILTHDVYEVRGKTTFKEEFVTCGGVSLNDINMSTMQSKIVNGLYFAGEVLDIDAITGGYNFQAAWTTGFIAGQLS